jgi:hypothetical protein
VIAIDYTKSNQWSGKKSYGGKPLHYLDPDNLEKNPYIQVRCRRRVLLCVYAASGLNRNPERMACTLSSWPAGYRDARTRDGALR